MFAQPIDEIPDNIKKQIRDLSANNIPPDIISAFYKINEDTIRDIVKSDDITVEEVIGINAVEPIEQGSELSDESEESEAIEIPQSSVAQDFASLSDNALVECNETDEDRANKAAKAQIKRLIKPLAEIARTNRPEGSKGPLWQFLPPKDSIALRRLVYQLDQLEAKTAKIDKCEVDKIEKELADRGMKIVRSRKGEPVLMLEDLPELGKRE
jgi:hypothetical protein